MTKQPIRLTLLCLICLMIPVVASAQVVFIPDPSLRSIIEQKVGKAPGAAISPADMERMTELRANNENIRNLTGLEHATNLIVLWLAENNISHLVPLEGLTRLTELDLSANSISNIASLARLTNLRGLYLGENYISNLAPIARLTQLIYLNLGENRISNISYLSGLTQLRELGLWTNSITDISPLARLTNLTLLDLGVNSISDISVLAGLINLSKLWIDNNSISDLSPLVANAGLRSGDTVDVDSNPLNHASINSHIPTLRSRGVTVELEEILVQQNAVNIPDPNLRNALEQVLGKARGAAITTDDMARLNILGATDENIRNLTGLEHATNLTELWLRDNSISDISPIAGLTRLIVLDLRDNLISNISPLARLTNLTALGLTNNNITNISPLAGLRNLIELGLGQNSITNISPLAGLTALDFVWLSDNSISDLSPLVANSGLRSGDEVDVTGNPLSHRSLNTHIPTLQSRGVTVEFDQIVAPPQTVNIPDSNLRNAIEQILRKARGATITVADMERLDAVYATSKHIRHLTGLEHATNLTELGLVDNSISDLSPLAGLTRLRVLDLRDNFISNISPLARLTNLTELGLAENSISNISPLAGLTNLTILRLDDNSISDISPLSGLTRLSELYLKNNKISDLRPLVINRGLGSGDKLDVKGNPLSDVSFDSHIPTIEGRGVRVEYDILKASVNIPDPNIRNAIRRTLNKPRDAPIREEDMARLTELEVTHKTITNLTGLEFAINLRKLNLRNNAIRDISPLAGLIHLTELNLRNNLLSDISPLAGLTKLEKLYLDNNSISDISPLAGLTKLKQLYLESNTISDLFPLITTGLGNGAYVNVKRNPLDELSIRLTIPTLQSRGVTVETDIVTVPLHIPDPNLRHAIEQALGIVRWEIITVEDITPLTQLDAKNRNITNLTGLEAATNLRKLELQENSISDISPIAGLTKLEKLYLQNNTISDISPLAGLTKLKQLYLQNNTISDISPLVENTGLRNGDQVFIQGNPLSSLSINTHIPALQSRGVTVESDIVVAQVNIPDPNLRNAIERALGKARGATITADEMTRLTQLDAKNKNISNLTGLEAATNLRNLKLQENSISDISPIAGLTQMVFLYLRDNSISDISPLSRLTQLIVLHLGGNRISNISPLAGLTNLAGLGLGRNNITDISPLSRLTKLTSLGLHSNSISNISAIERLTKLNEIFLYDNSISDLSPLVANTGLRSGDQVFVKENPLSSLSINTHIPTLQSRGVKVEFDVPVKIVNIPDPNLRNAIEKVLGKARGATITGAEMERLIALHATSENITNLTGLENATNLTELRLVDNNITDISPLAGLTKLRQLWLDDNSITDISALAGLINLSELRLMNNSISDISPLVRNAGLGSADWIDLKGNFLNNAAINTHIPILESRGIVLEYDQIGVPVKIPDHNLRNAIEKVLGKASGATITTADMATLNTLYAISENIRNLTGLESATNLTELGLRNNSIANLSPLVTLTSLTLLDLQDNLVSDLSPLAGLTKLTVLRLARNSITDISPLARLTKLTELNLENNIISDISPLTRLTQLIELSLQQNIISDLSPLVANTGLGNGDRVYVKGNPLDALSLSSHIPVLQSRRVTVEFDQVVVPPQTVNIPDPNLRNRIEKALGKVPGAPIAAADMERLITFQAAKEKITNLTGLENATKLAYLYLGNNSISDISPLAGLTQLLLLDLRGNLISDISPLAGLTRLEHLYSHNNLISDISPLSRLINLKTIRLTRNSISDISPLVTNTGLGRGDWIGVKENPLNNASINTHIPTLQRRGVAVEFDNIVVPPKTVNIPDTNLRNAIEQVLGTTITVADMETLIALHATNKNITNLTGLELATNLKELRLVDNNITNVSPLAGLTKLTQLWLDGNSISDISALAGLTNLKDLKLSNNSISDLWPLVANTGLGNGDKVNVKENPLSDISIKTHIPTLQSRGVTVEFDQIVVPPQTVDIPDRNLRNAIEQLLGKARGATITVPDMETLDVLDATNKNITDLTGLEYAINLTELVLQNNSISDLSPLLANTGLRNGDKVNVKENPLSDLALQTIIPTLQSRGVTVEFDQIGEQPNTVNIPDRNLRSAVEQLLGKAQGDTITVAEMETLDVLSAINKNITNLTGLEAATQLTILDLRDNPLSDISPLAGLTNLTVLRLARNNITDISPVVRLTKLTVLNLRDNSVSDISAIAGLTNLTVLRIDINSISNISPLSRLTKLTQLYLGQNSISDLSPLVANTGLGHGDRVIVKENPLSTVSFNTHIPTLQSRGVNVEFDEIVAQPADVNDDGVVNIFDLVSVVSEFGTQGENIVEDVNGDGVVNIFDLVVIAGAFRDAAAAPSAQLQEMLTAAEVRGWLTDAKSLDIKDPIMKQGIMVLEELLRSLAPTETQLLPNYPNPFNPETWIPYRLAKDAFVTLTIYDQAGQVVRTIDVGHQPAAIYESRSQAIYWDGRNQVGEKVASGVYFYHLAAGDYSATRKMLILK